MYEAHKGHSSKRATTADSASSLAIAERTDAAMCDVSSVAYSDTQSMSDLVPYSPPGVGVRDTVAYVCLCMRLYVYTSMHMCVCRILHHALAFVIR